MLLHKLRLILHPSIIIKSIGIPIHLNLSTHANTPTHFLYRKTLRQHRLKYPDTQFRVVFNYTLISNMLQVNSHICRSIPQLAIMCTVHEH